MIHVYQEGWSGGGISETWIVAAFSHLGPLREVEKIQEWCLNTFGEAGERWQDDIKYGEIRFRDSSDLTAFLLKWQ